MTASRSAGPTRHLNADGVWCQVVRPDGAEAFAGRAALFLDRDGVIVEETGYLHRPADVRLIDGAAATIAAANRRGVPAVVLTNQSGIGRGLYDWDAFAATQACIQDALGAEGAAVDMVLACPFHPEGRPEFRHAAHPCRKPRPGMLLLAADVLGLDLAKSWIVGDRAIDLEAGHAAGLAGGLHVVTGHGADERAAVAALDFARFEIRLGRTIAEARDLVPLLGAVGDEEAGQESG